MRELGLKTLDTSPITLPNGSQISLHGQIAAGEIVALKGPSGCGKTSVLESLALVATGPHSRAKFSLNGKESAELEAHTLSCGLAFQSSELFPHLNVLENLCFPLKFRAPFSDWDRSLHEKRANEFLAEWGLSDLAGKDPSTLSGGEAQRISLLRSLIFEPELLLLDEALSALDKDTKDRVKKWTRSFIKEKKIATLLVCHSDEDWKDFADRVVHWPEKDGSLDFSQDSSSA